MEPAQNTLIEQKLSILAKEAAVHKFISSHFEKAPCRYTRSGNALPIIGIVEGVF